MSCEDKAKCGRPISVVDETNVTIICSLVDENPHSAVDEMFWSRDFKWTRFPYSKEDP